MSLRDNIATAPGVVRLRRDVGRPDGYVVFDCETTGTDPRSDEIVSFALLRLDEFGAEVAERTGLVKPSRPIPLEATAVHEIDDADVATAPRFDQIAPELLALLADAVFVAHNAAFDLRMLQQELARAGAGYAPLAVACTLEAFRVLDPQAPVHGLDALCQRHAIARIGHSHDALSDAGATAGLLRLLLQEGIAPETIHLDKETWWRLRSRGDARPASEAQIRRIFALGHAAHLDRPHLLQLVERITGTADVDTLTREQIQDVYDALERAVELRRAA